MQFDDRLATVLRMRAGSEAGLRTQFRQLLDLLGTRKTMLRGPSLARIARLSRHLSKAEIDRLLMHPALASEDLRLGTIAGYVRLDEIMQALPQEVQSEILREPGLRLRNPTFVAFLAESEPKPAAAAMATARLDEREWLDLIPVLPVTARGFLRHRRDLPPSAKQVLERLGVRDLVLPMGASVQAQEETAPAEPADQSSTKTVAAEVPASDDPIGRLRRRIEAFQESRRTPSTHPRLPLGDAAHHRDSAPPDLLDVLTDASGIVISSDGLFAPMLVGLHLTAPQPGELVSFDEDVATLLRQRQPLRHARIAISAAPDVSGDWRMDATPLFAPGTGAFTGYAARLYRPVEAPEAVERSSPADAMRQVLHELRTPVNAIQGFAEIIQQQLFGNVPHEYRAHAAAIAVDAAKLLAGFDEVDRLVKLDSQAMELEEGECDFRSILVETIRRLEGVLRPRNAGFRMAVSGSPFDVALSRDEALVLSWRLLATAAAALGPGEEAQMDLHSDGEFIVLQLDIPETLRDAAPDTSREAQRRKVVSAGMFGPRFTFRLAEAEARSAGGMLECEGDRVTLRLPTLTSANQTHSTVTDAGGG
ncbi:sensor histidine kinase [Aurantiacibacter sp. MUD11]|uniref:histidine kinase dimerization/phospho-acceptor domain-containing protein n=1 Tax=Aurantiacibacter sp. MUD11 TaxID=3003265 RepID=UPI0022AA5554|nr:histidine kinase dimerization/phospho-acceptor domain-containing protein [Aurantiacibacter sp. MUD11]WAT18706.1 sensor histidine kinase [Aurantiacibacter sp. MUD11]